MQSCDELSSSFCGCRDARQDALAGVAPSQMSLQESWTACRRDGYRPQNARYLTSLLRVLDWGSASRAEAESRAHRRRVLRANREHTRPVRQALAPFEPIFCCGPRPRAGFTNPVP